MPNKEGGYAPNDAPLAATDVEAGRRSDSTAKDCSGCPLAAVCRDPKAKRGRTLLRDAHEPSRERMYERMHSAEGQAIYALRMHAAETPFAFIKFAIASTTRTNSQKTSTNVRRKPVGID